ncbi:MAG: tRNA pseudouridine(13) synthase TruD [candidate division SR1 bacterium]|nr:tRNA pseudouridine(13) synthase TruD [candidate division SR1 bacterium]
MDDRLFSFKQKSQDFIVTEELPFKFANEGDVFFVFFEKRNLNTMDVVKHICNSRNLSRLALGIAGLKDKKAITRQRICIYKSALKKIGGENGFLETIGEVAKVLDTGWHTTPIGMTTPIKNGFYIKLRANKKLSEKEKDISNRKILSLFKKGFPNLFGNQRFGINGINPQQGSDILAGRLKLQDKKDLVFKIQAYASKIFNEYLHTRTKKGLEIIDGDIVIDTANTVKNQLGLYQAKSDTIKIFDDTKDKVFFRYPEHMRGEIAFNKETMIATGPVIGYNLLLTPKDSAAGKKEQGLLEKNGISEKSLKLCIDYKIYGIRRPLWVFPEKVHVHFQQDDILLNFSLPGGAYASIMIDELEKTLGVKVS